MPPIRVDASLLSVAAICHLGNPAGLCANPPIPRHRAPGPVRFPCDRRA